MIILFLCMYHLCIWSYEYWLWYLYHKHVFFSWVIPLRSAVLNPWPLGCMSPNYHTAVTQLYAKGHCAVESGFQAAWLLSVVGSGLPNMACWGRGCCLARQGIGYGAAAQPQRVQGCHPPPQSPGLPTSPARSGVWGCHPVPQASRSASGLPAGPTGSGSGLLPDCPTTQPHAARYRVVAAARPHTIRSRVPATGPSAQVFTPGPR